MDADKVKDMMVKITVLFKIQSMSIFIFLLPLSISPRIFTHRTPPPPRIAHCLNRTKAVVAEPVSAFGGELATIV